MAESVSGRGKIVVAVLVVVLVALAVVFGMSRTNGERVGPQGKGGGAAGAGSPETRRDTPALNPGRGGDIADTVASDTGRNAPAPAGAPRQDAPTGSLTDGPNVDAEKSAEPARQ